ncbi:MAG: protein kinase, partial [Proteobacteria bacterium]|nr:protein kinase [Pseudomonadota bacterium]
MTTAPGYQQLKLIHQGRFNLVYSAESTSDGQPVILRQLRPELVSAQLLHRNKVEYELLGRIDSAFVIKPIELIETDDSSILVTEKPPGRPLIDCIEDHELDMPEAVSIAHLIARGLDELHQHDVVHRDINPANIIYDPDGPGIKLIDFGISSSQSFDQITSEVNRTLEGTLAYLSPEQTGRMNRSVDFRSDLFLQALCFYQLLT